VRDTRLGMRWFWAGTLLGAILAASMYACIWYFNWDLVAVPRFECDLSTSKRCDDTRFAWWYDIEGRPSSIRVHEGPEEWGDSFWAVTIERYFQSPVTAVCYYSSDDEVSCEGGPPPN
jgi:hypothetical protein